VTEVFVASGVWASAGDKGHWIDLKETKPAAKDGFVQIAFGFGSAGLKPAEARKLAAQLYELAARTDERGK
jgi:hypothetical protein